MNRYFFNSGLYETAFYTQHKIDFYNDSIEYEAVEYNNELLAKHYMDDLDLEYNNEEEQWEQVNQIFWENLSYYSTYFEPLVFNEEIALKCGLTPFTYQGINMLALSGCGMDLSPRLDAYQALSHNTIDKNSRLFSTANSEDRYFEYVVGQEIADKVWRSISRD